MQRTPRLEDLDAAGPPVCRWCGRPATTTCDQCFALVCDGHRQVRPHLAARFVVDGRTIELRFDLCPDHYVK